MLEKSGQEKLNLKCIISTRVASQVLAKFVLAMNQQQGTSCKQSDAAELNTNGHEYIEQLSVRQLEPGACTAYLQGGDGMLVAAL